MSAMSLAGTDFVGENDVAYEVEGGCIYFDPGTGTITGADAEITAADIPAEIEGATVTAIGDAVERQELIWMLWKLADEPETDDSELDRFADAASVGADYRAAVAWALKNGITTGTDRGIEPEKSTNRTEFAAFVMRAYDLF